MGRWLGKRLRAKDSGACMQSQVGTLCRLPSALLPPRSLPSQRFTPLFIQSGLEAGTHFTAANTLPLLSNTLPENKRVLIFKEYKQFMEKMQTDKPILKERSQLHKVAHTCNYNTWSRPKDDGEFRTSSPYLRPCLKQTYGQAKRRAGSREATHTLAVFCFPCSLLSINFI